jgi:hypothetical protein
MFLLLNKQYRKVLLIATIARAQESLESELRLGSYEDFMIGGLFAINKTWAGT